MPHLPYLSAQCFAAQLDHVCTLCSTTIEHQIEWTLFRWKIKESHPAPVIPASLTNIIENNREVQKKLRAYNNLFSFTAVSASGDKGLEHIPGVSTLILHGKTYHRMLNGNM